MESGRGPPPPDLTCPVCADLLKNAVEMPCCRCGATFAGLGDFLKLVCLLCRVGVCRSCAIKKLVKSKKRCWLLTTSTCHEAPVQIDQVGVSNDI